MRSNKSFRVLLGSLFLGVAVASAVWLLIVPHDRGISNAQARHLGFSDAALYNRASTFRNTIERNKRISEDELREAALLLKSSNQNARIDGLQGLGFLGGIPSEEEKALKLILPLAHDPDPNIRHFVVLKLLRFRHATARQTLQAMTSDPDEGVRRLAREAVK